MPLTKQIIIDAVRGVVKEELKPVNARLFEVENKLDKLESKFDIMSNTLTDFAGQVKKFDEEQTVMSGQLSNRTDRIENIEIKVFGQVQTA